MTWWRRLLDALRPGASDEERLQVTDRAPFQCPEYAVGRIVPFHGRLYEVTRWSQGKKIYLSRGGSVVQWEIYGRPASEEEVSETVSEAAERMLREPNSSRGEGFDADERRGDDSRD